MKSSPYIIIALTLILSAALVVGPVASGIGKLSIAQATYDLNGSSINASSSGNGQSQIVTLQFFYGDTCPHCAIVEPVIDSLSAKYPQVDFERYEIYDNSTNNALFQQFNYQYGVQNPVVPEVYIGGKVLIGEDVIMNDLESEIQRLLSINNNGAENNNGSNTSTGNASNIGTENTNDTSAGDANNASTENTNSTVSLPNNNGTMPSGPGRTGSESSTDPGPSVTVVIGMVVVALAALLVIGLVVHRKKRNKGQT